MFAVLGSLSLSESPFSRKGGPTTLNHIQIRRFSGAHRIGSACQCQTGAIDHFVSGISWAPNEDRDPCRVLCRGRSG